MAVLCLNGGFIEFSPDDHGCYKRTTAVHLCFYRVKTGSGMCSGSTNCVAPTHWTQTGPPQHTGLVSGYKTGCSNALESFCDANWATLMHWAGLRTQTRPSNPLGRGSPAGNSLPHVARGVGYGNDDWMQPPWQSSGLTLYRGEGGADEFIGLSRSAVHPWRLYSILTTAHKLSALSPMP